MANEFWMHDGIQFRKAKEVWMHDGTAFRKAKEIWVHDGTQFRKVFQRAGPQFSGSYSASNTGVIGYNGVVALGAGIMLRPDGSISSYYWTDPTSGAPYSGYTHNIGKWADPLQAGQGAGYCCRVVETSGAWTSQPGGLWLYDDYKPLSSDCLFYLQIGAQGASVVDYTIQIWSIEYDSGEGAYYPVAQLATSNAASVYCEMFPDE